MSLEVGKVYRNSDGSNAVLVFGLAEYVGVLGKENDGIGIDLITGKVSQVHKYANVVLSIDNLSDEEIINLGFYKEILVKLQKSRIVSISGKARSGKDYLAGLLVRSNMKYTRTALGDPIKDIYKTLYGSTNKKDRTALIMIGQGLRKEDPHIWIKTWLRLAVESLKYDDSSRLVVTDVRQPNEFSFFKTLGALTVRVVANEQERRNLIEKKDGKGALSDKLLNDETESHSGSFDVDIEVKNNYDNTFYKEVSQVMNLI